MKTRQEYMASQCTYDEYYSQFADRTVLRIVENGIGLERIRASTDPHFNDIRLSRWDGLSFQLEMHVKPSLKAAGDCVSMAGLVCIAKAAARILKAKGETHEPS